MDTRRLRSFVQIADCGSITRAAAEAGLAQPALSQHLAALEHELKVKLVERSASGVRLTPAGEALYGRAQVILQQLDDLKADVSSESGLMSGPIALGLPPTMVEILTLPLLDALCREHPELRPQVLEEGGGYLEELLARGGLDIVVSPRRPDNPAVVSELLFREPLLLVAPAAWDLKPGMGLTELSRLPWVTTRRRHSVRVQVEALFAEAGLEHRVVAEIDSLTTVVRCVQHGLGATVLPRGVARHAEAGGGVQVLDLCDPPLMRTMFLCWRKAGQLSRRSETVLKMIRDLARRQDATCGS
jgi:LysR family nitrogen assimilation transcriptional regulator